MAIKSVAEKAQIWMRIGQEICELVDASGILVKPKRKPRVTKKKKIVKPKAPKKAPRPRQEEPDDEDED